MVDVQLLADEILENLELMLGPFDDRAMAANIIETVLNENLNTN